MDTQQATGLAATFLSFDPQGEKNFSEEVFCDDLPEGESLFGEIFPDQEAMKSHYLLSACQLWPEACTGGREKSHLRHLLSRLRKRRLMLYLLCRNWARQHWQLQSECLGLIAENGLSQQQKRNMIRVLNLALYQACELMGMRDFIREELALCCRQIRELQELLKRMEGKSGKGKPEAVEEKEAEEAKTAPAETREETPLSEPAETLAVSGRNGENPVSEQEEVPTVSGWSDEHPEGDSQAALPCPGGLPEAGPEAVTAFRVSGRDEDARASVCDAVSAPEHAGDPSEGSKG